MVNLLTAGRWFGVEFACVCTNGLRASLVHYETQPQRLEICHTG